LLEEAEAHARPTQAEPIRPTRFPSPESYSHTIVVPPTPRPPSPQRTDQIDQMVAVRNLSVIRGKKKLVEGIDFTVNRGEIVGLMGPSGAGKTTIIKVLTTEYPAESGQVAVGGYDLTTQSQSAKQVFGYVPQETQLYEDLTFLQNVTYFGGQYGLDQAYLIERAQRLASVVELGDRINDKVGRFSGGQKKRVSVATALAHNPDLLVLDEPTSGLDPATRRSLWKFLKSVNQSYMVTMLITTHFLDEGEYCDKLLIINKGHMVAYDSPRNLKRKMPGEGKAIELEMFTLDDYVSAKLFEFEARAKRERVAEMVDRSGYRVKVFCRNIPESLSRIPALLSELGLGFKALDIVDTSLEDVFIYLTGEHFKEEE
jgi:ABC-2 type transport system ATP-binding protein